VTAEKYLKILKLYEDTIIDMGGYEQRAVDHSACPTVDGAVGHAWSMLPKMREMILAGDTEKAMRWLGFVQGIFWTSEVFTIEDMKNHNRSDS
jgi:hypothetical protein